MTKNNLSSSEQQWSRARAVLAGGVNSPVRAFNAVGGTPVFIDSALGSRITDIDGGVYIDYVGSWGCAITGHAHPRIVNAVRAQAGQGLSFGAPTKLESDLAEAVREFFPSMERMRFVNSGTEACMSAIRLARGHTNRKLIITFAGCYHGHADSFLGNAGSGLLSLDITEAAGVIAELSRYTLSLPYNDTAALKQAFDRHGSDIAAVMVEPVAANMNLIPPHPGFLDSVIDLCQRSGAVSIFDEVISGFRVHSGGAQALYALQPDLTILGKVVGGGLPVGVYGGLEAIMAKLAPQGKIYQAGTLSGNPLVMRAGLETLKIIAEEDTCTHAGGLAKSLAEQMNEIARRHQLSLCARSVGALFGLHFMPEPAQSLDDIKVAAHSNTYRRFFHEMLNRGVYLAPSPFEAGFVSGAHSAQDIDATLTAFDLSCQSIVSSD
ncbi:MAG: glutamate-1-semialdehyde 2,1-aminomutase [Proteobacteria bacterium]|nr:glutamate-1-semialdehyde 2,1-aminomutase [Pseudomonadota bacterium]